jgi:PAS domain S-box-containing protein
MADQNVTAAPSLGLAAGDLGHSEELFRLISENVTDLIAVVDSSGRRIYNSPSYLQLLGDPAVLQGTDCFQEIHPDDRERIKRVFAETLATGIGQRAEYRMITPRGIHHIESQGNVLRDPASRSPRLLVVSRDVTERKETIEVLRQALTDLNETHDQLKVTQQQLVEAERVQAVSTFAAGVAHEVRNPLQTIILGVDYLSGRLAPGEETSAMVLREMGQAVQRADAIIRGLMEFGSTTAAAFREENLNSILELSIRAVESEFAQHPVQFAQRLAPTLPVLKLEARVMKHVFINLLLYAMRSLRGGGTLTVSTGTRIWTGPGAGANGGYSQLKPGDSVVVAVVECMHAPDALPSGQDQPKGNTSAGVGLTVLKKIVELYGGAIETPARKGLCSKYCVMFRYERQTKL